MADMPFSLEARDAANLDGVQQVGELSLWDSHIAVSRKPLGHGDLYWEAGPFGPLHP